MNKLIRLIEDEDKRNPLTDEEIALRLKVRRGDVIKLRHEMGIKDSRERKNELLEPEIRGILTKNPAISIRGITEILNAQGYKVSRNIVSKFYREYSNIDHDERKDRKDRDGNKALDAFDTLIGAAGSLKPQIELAKAAILYPNNGLHTLLYGATGVGKSDLAECMYKFSVESGVRKKEAPFIVFNCADYAENPQLLLAQLFGYTKGAYTGAESNKEGLVEKAHTGILFLDEVHRLPPEGQEILFHLIDKGKFRRLGETGIHRDVEVMIIAATTEDIESTLLATFRRRIPMVIELPTLSKRPLEEKLQIIKSFFRKEANRMNATIVIASNVLTALLLYETKGNIGQLRSDIQVVCARGFLNYMVKKEKVLRIEITDLSSQVLKGLLKMNQYRNIVEKIIYGDIEICPSKDVFDDQLKEPNYMFPNEIYKEIEEKYQKMERKGIDNPIINRILGDELELKISQLVKQFQHNNNAMIKQDLEKIVGEKIVNLVEKMMKKAKKRIPNIDDSLFYCLATHLSTSYERLRHNKPINNPKLKMIQMEYPFEYEIAEEMSKIASYYLEMDLPDDEIAFIAMYLKTYSAQNLLNVQHVGILVLSHGHVAEGMAAVANRLLGVEHAKAIEMSLDESPDKALERAVDEVKRLDTGKGVLLLVDMGSLVGFGNIITERTGIKTRIISRVDTTMVIDAVRKAMLPDSDIHEIVDSLQSKFICESNFGEKRARKHSKVIVSICLTGKGAAELIKKVIDQQRSQRNENVEVITIGALAELNLDMVINKLYEKKDILAIVGTIDPKIPGIPFISAKEIFRGDGIARINHLFYIHDHIKDYEVEDPSLRKLIRPDLIFVKSDIKSKNEVLNIMAEQMVQRGCVTENYIYSVYERELLSPTLFKNQIALPHGNPEEILTPAISIATLASPIEWEKGEEVSCVIMLALSQYNRKEFTKLYRLINDEKLLERMNKVDQTEMLMEVLLEND
ncbi:MAG: polymerase subunit sigma-54 [Anaerosolibacter sp.]|jgi:transcriptional regulator with AAA-type ATPase domain/transcriptional regulatory protein LevR|uniref:sigma 54-interacting transcriptional regulator n=1 Tax=Anaerosolibacter sp. TaxID=1872527 RepID=UPI00263652FB|nr:sigma 54-interacting transcriptional regulator [Anaerosolibacter sp.]MDF2548399.1 polymerase subunit sigma-54 [Anaerosolibacter sp.]